MPLERFSVQASDWQSKSDAVMGGWAESFSAVSLLLSAVYALRVALLFLPSLPS
jgi:hypothetical protein